MNFHENYVPIFIPFLPPPSSYRPLLSAFGSLPRSRCLRVSGNFATIERPSFRICLICFFFFPVVSDTFFNGFARNSRNSHFDIYDYSLCTYKTLEHCFFFHFVARIHRRASLANLRSKSKRLSTSSIFILPLSSGRRESSRRIGKE